MTDDTPEWGTSRLPEVYCDLAIIRSLVAPDLGWAREEEIDEALDWVWYQLDPRGCKEALALMERTTPDFITEEVVAALPSRVRDVARVAMEHARQQHKGTT